MNGYYIVKHNPRNPEVEPLDFSQIEYVSENEEEYTPTDIGPPQHHRYKHKCPRCESIQTVASRFPYCSECNWDSLVNALETYDKWAV